MELLQDDDGWDYGVCLCGWRTPPCPGADIVADAYGDHRAEAAGATVTPSVVFFEVPDPGSET
ncbi:MAG: hypothetical protein GWN73_14440 [Actinobacteria bacterium]|nr:hypothetical protein [Actinomycetota bacterium]NIS31428.1 hypothetical protein [Actinomycetota bacterium]NIU66546.1 hypothetical protein [Actinomycetota bacterium]NIW28350.1 hypothetical protein [Actinomycetota bacterium]